MVGVYLVVLLLVVLDVLVAVHMVYLRRANRNQAETDRLLLEAKRQEITLIASQSKAIDWLVEDAKKDIQTAREDIKTEAEQTRQEVKEQVAEVKEHVKQEIHDSLGREGKVNGGVP